MMRHRPLLATAAAFAVTAALTVVVPIPAGDAAAASPTCAASTAPAGYTASVCITAPAANATITGNTTVSATVTITGTAPALDGVEFTLDGTHLIFAFQAPYHFTFHPYLTSLGTHTLGAAAKFSGGYFTTPASIPLYVFPPAPPSTPSFTPRTGTNPPAGQPLVVGVTADGGTGMTAEQKVSDLVASWNPNMFLYLGDVYEQGSPEEFLNWYGENGSYYSRFRSITNPAPGNHEYTPAGTAAPYFAYWGNPPDNYSLTTHGWHIISLDDAINNNQDKTTSAQYQWLQNDLKNNTAACTLVEWHRPVYSLNSAEEASNFATYWQLFNQYHVTMVVSGHSHNYQHWTALDANGNPSPTGVTEFIVGTGGNWISPFDGTDPRVVAGADTTATAWGALRLGLSSAGASYQFTNISGQTLDSGTLPCQNTGPDTSAPSAPTGLRASVVSGREVDLTWTASTDNVGVTSYQILRNGTVIGSASGYQTTFADTTVSPSQTYSYTVVALDAAGNRSAASTAATANTPAAAPTFVQSAVGSTGSKVASMTLQLGKPVGTGEVLIGMFGQYDAAGQVQVSDPVNGPWTRIRGGSYSSGKGDIGLYYVRSAPAPGGLTVSVSASAPTYLQASASDYWGVADTDVIATSAFGSGKGTAADSGPTATVSANSVLFTAMMTGGAPGTVTPGSSAGVPIVMRASNGSMSVDAADVLATAAGVQHGAFTLGTATDWYAAAAVLTAAGGVQPTPTPTPTPTTTSSSPTPTPTATSSSPTPTPTPTTSSSSPPPPSSGYVQATAAGTGSKVATMTLTLGKPVTAGDLLVGWFAQYDAAGQVSVSDPVNGAWTRGPSATFSNGGGDVALYYVTSAKASSTLAISVTAGAPTYLEATAGDYAGSFGSLLGASVRSGRGTAADSGSTATVPAGSLVIGALITGGNPLSAAPGSSAGVPFTKRAATSSGSITLADVSSSAAGAQVAPFALGASTDWYALCAVFGS